MPLRDRANVVCTQCHSRKIKCDLQTNPNGSCKNCRHSGHPCIQRNGVRRSRNQTNFGDKTPEFRSRSTRTRAILEGDFLSSPMSEALTSTAQPESESVKESPRSAQKNDKFVSYCSVIQLGSHLEVTTADSTDFDSLRDVTLKATQAAGIPRPTLFRAMADAYLTHVFHHCPVVDPSEALGPDSSILLKQALCMVGNLIRHDSTGPVESHRLYRKLKLLLAIDYEDSCVQTLKTLCLMSCFSIKPSDPVSLDGPWKWTGQGIQLAIQMGLHRESTYTQRLNAGCLRRIFWQLYNNDSLHFACWGRPPRLRRNDFDVRLPTLEDFDVQNTQSLAFIEITKLCTIMTCISELYMESRAMQQAELSRIDVALRDWVRNVPEYLQLFDAEGRRKPYYRPALEVYIQYFVAIVMSQMLRHNETDRPWRVSLPSWVAASCAALLYDEIFCRDHTVFLLPNHGFFCLAVSLPLICYHPQSQPRIAQRKQGIAVIRSILERLRDRYGDADMVLGKMEKVQDAVDKSPRLDEWSEAVLPGFQGANVHPKDLFPFPADICKDLELLDVTPAPEQQTAMNQVPLPLDEHMEDIPFGCSFIDLFELDYTAFDLMDENIVVAQPE